MRLLFISDFTEQFAYRLLHGVLEYSRQTDDPWMIWKMPPAYKRQLGMQGLIDWVKDWKADVVIGQFDPDDDISLFRKNGIVALAQDYITRFNEIPNITSDYEGTGAMAAKRFLARGFLNFAFFGYKGVCWSDDRCKGYLQEVKDAGLGDAFYLYDFQEIDNLWSYDRDRLTAWLRTLPKPIAILCCDDNQACTLLLTCNYCGIKVPSEVAIIGVDNDEIVCNLSVPSLSSINLDIEQGGYEAAAMAVRMVNDPSFRGEDIVIQPKNIVTRTSSNIFATHDPAVLSALQFIGSNIDHKILVTDVLKEVPMSRRLLEQRFRKETGTSIYQYITSLRMDRMAELLLSSNESVADIAARLEEPDPKSISRRFQAVKGVTPSEFRKRKLRKMSV